MIDTCPNCGGDLQALDDRGSRIACTECPWMKTPVFEGLPIGSSDDGFEGEETTEDVPEKAERPIQFEVPEIVEEHSTPTELVALKELLRFDGRSKSEIAEELDVNIGSVSAASGRYEYFRQNGHFDGPELDFDGDISNYDPSRNRYKKYQQHRKKSASKGTMRAQAQSLAKENPEMSYEEIQDTVGYKKRTDAVQAVRDIDGGYKFERFSPMRQDILREMKNGEVELESLAEKYDTDTTEISSHVGSAHQHWIDDIEIPDNGTESDPEVEAETEIQTEIEQEQELKIEDESPVTPQGEQSPPHGAGVEGQHPKNINGKVTVTIDKESLFAIVVGEEIEKEERRQIFDEIVT